MNSEERQRLDDWAAHLSSELGIASDEFRAAMDVDGILDLAGVAAHSVIRPAAPVTTFLVGYAAGLAAAAGTDPSSAIRSADALSRAALAAASDATQPAAAAAASDLAPESAASSGSATSSAEPSGSASSGPAPFGTAE
ncbi:molybdopterin-guanine dinucleotide biosynthesis protein MobA [Salinibacterium sp. UTAS2018]|uniref:DUF6457 domain-containing protein n=1 Tax=Salinibacterium sp. UTAS2018 TaxID=2508880 RepID=UPI00100941BD|nr:DUF6457 domain-containing protein [Salinibacterium sp. UTAS2018]QAV70314.1 molybdopterin-guanine dinucleotide biosynthesis protein MobA [Salinibacterium sp. UTAS2018]